MKYELVGKVELYTDNKGNTQSYEERWNNIDDMLKADYKLWSCTGDEYEVTYNNVRLKTNNADVKMELGDDAGFVEIKEYLAIQIEVIDNE